MSDEDFMEKYYDPELIDTLPGLHVEPPHWKLPPYRVTPSMVKRWAILSRLSRAGLPRRRDGESATRRRAT